MSTEPDMILIVTDVPFWRGEAGAHQRIASLCRALYDAGYDVGVFYPTHLSEVDRAQFQDRFPECILYLPPPHLLALRLLRGKLGFRGPLLWERRRALRYLCLHCLPKFIIFQYLRTAPLRHKLERAVPYPIQCLMDTHDVQHLRAASLGHNDADRPLPAITREEEAAQLEPFDAILAIQDQEAAELRAMCPDSPVLRAGHTHPIHSPVQKPDVPVRLLFIAGEGQHNQDAISAFLREVWPGIHAACGDRVELCIAGRIGDHLDAATLPDGVYRAGYVADLNALYAETHIAVNPIFGGSGLKIKNVEALCHSLPLVTTPVGAQGLEDGADSAFVVCETPDAMRAALIRLIGDADARDTLAKAAQAYAEAHFTPAAAYGELVEFLRQHS